MLRCSGTSRAAPCGSPSWRQPLHLRGLVPECRSVTVIERRKKPTSSSPIRSGKLDDEIIDSAAWDVLRVAPE